MSNMEKSVADVLNDAADIVERGWCQGVYIRGDSCCTTYAIWAALGDPTNKAFDALSALVGGNIIEWNDAPKRTQAEVVAKLREASALARAEAK